jgi:hypothetical protein
MEEGALPARNRVVDLINNDNRVEGGPVAGTYLSRELFEAVASRNHEALLHAYATNARASLLRYAAAKSRWSSWIPQQNQQQNQSPSARLRRRQHQQHQGTFYGREKILTRLFDAAHHGASGRAVVVCRAPEFLNRTQTRKPLRFQMNFSSFMGFAGVC